MSWSPEVLMSWSPDGLLLGSANSNRFFFLVVLVFPVIFPVSWQEIQITAKMCHTNSSSCRIFAWQTAKKEAALNSSYTIFHLFCFQQEWKKLLFLSRHKKGLTFDSVTELAKKLVTLTKKISVQQFPM